MLATQVRQKDSVFYFAAYPSEDLLDKVRFISRFYADGDKIAAEEVDAGDDVGHFIARPGSRSSGARAKRTDGVSYWQMPRSNPKPPS